LVVVLVAIEEEVEEDLWVCNDLGEPGDRGEVGNDPACAAALSSSTWIAVFGGSLSD
jgi:hypothetical protein